MAYVPNEKVDPTVIVQKPLDVKSGPIEAIKEEDQSSQSGCGLTPGDSDDEPQYDFDSEEFAHIPELVRTVVGFEDDPTLPVITFRSVLLSSIFCIIGSFVSQLSL